MQPLWTPLPPLPTNRPWRLGTTSYVYPEGITPDATPARVAAWQGHMSESIARLLDLGLAPHLLAMENLGMPFDWCAPIIESAGLSVCLDIGHLWRYGVPVEAHLQRWLPRTRVVHLHGECNGRDHISLAATDRTRLTHFLRLLQGPPPFTGVVSLEVFSEADTASSIHTLHEILL
jgi:sugar phosphate isomerase/epimerase